MIHWFEKHNKISWAITILGAVLIFAFSSINFSINVLGETGHSLISITYHFCAFFLFSLFLFISVNRTNFVFFWAILLAIFYGALDEVHQLFVPGRFPDISDVVLDSIGILFSSVIYFSYKKHHK